MQGHEGCGTVVEVGSEAKGFQPGDKIGWLPIVDCCFDCEECQVAITSRLQNTAVSDVAQ
jgi:propanol-preferring alcohol dehydrogenase